MDRKVGFRFLDRITAQHWSTVLGEEHGLSVHSYANNYLRIGEVSLKELKREIIRKLFRVMQRLEDIILMKRYSRCFMRWREMRKKSIANYDDYCYQIKFIFAVWKEFTLIDKLNNKCRRQGSILLYIILFNSIQMKLRRSFRKWNKLTKYWKKLLRQCFDSWSLWTLRSKLHQSNVLRFCKMVFLHPSKRSPKRLRWYFDTWKHHSDIIGKFALMQHSISL